ncbi:MAG: carbon monoxide dehydrogenase subunit G [Thermoanaerobaculia bacterium]|nr:carbon monoxide dehydrogenase subunit G [Thermoanaerobaculia bacterium]
MKLTGEFVFHASRDRVWDALFDPQILASVMPGCEKLEQVGENQYEGQLDIKVGPVQGKFQGKIELHDIERPDSYRMQIDGRGASGFVKANAGVQLSEDDEQTTLRYDGEAHVGGRVATVGQRLLESSAKAITKQSLEGLGRVVEVQDATADSEPAEIEGPSQSEFARNVAKDVAKDLLPMPMVFGGLVALVIVLLLIFAR